MKYGKLFTVATRHLTHTSHSMFDVDAKQILDKLYHIDGPPSMSVLQSDVVTTLMRRRVFAG